MQKKLSKRLSSLFGGIRRGVGTPPPPPPGPPPTSALTVDTANDEDNIVGSSGQEQHSPSFDGTSGKSSLKHADKSASQLDALGERRHSLKLVLKQASSPCSGVLKTEESSTWELTSPPPPPPLSSSSTTDESSSLSLNRDSESSNSGNGKNNSGNLQPAKETDIGTDAPFAPLLGKEGSEGDRLEKSSFEQRVDMIKGMSVQELIEYLHHDSTPPNAVTADERKAALSSEQSADHLQLVRVILTTLLEMIKQSYFDQTDIDPFILSLAPLLFKFRPKDKSSATYKNGYRKSGWVDRPINLQRTLLQKAILARDFVAVENLLNVVKLSRGNGVKVDEGEISDGIYSYLVKRHKPPPGSLNSEPRDEFLSGGNTFVYPSLILIMQLFVTGHNNAKAFDIFKLYLSTFELSPMAISGAIAYGLRHPQNMPKVIIGTLLAMVEDELCVLPEQPDKELYWDEEGEWCDILMDNICWAPEDFGRHPGENISAETPQAVRMQLIAYS